MHAGFCGNKLSQKNRVLENREKQNDTICSSCFHSLAHFIKIIKNVFLDVYNMLNKGKLQFLQLEIICYVNHA